MTVQEFCRKHHVNMSSSRTSRNPHMTDSNMTEVRSGAPMDHWRCNIRCGKRRMSLVFSKGSGHHGAPPHVNEVLDCLASDASSYDNNTSFESWAGDFGYDLDDRGAKKTFNAVKKQAASLKRLLGAEAYEELLYNTERM